MKSKVVQVILLAVGSLAGLSSAYAGSLVPFKKLTCNVYDERSYDGGAAWIEFSRNSQDRLDVTYIHEFYEKTTKKQIATNLNCLFHPKDPRIMNCVKTLNGYVSTLESRRLAATTIHPETSGVMLEVRMMSPELEAAHHQDSEDSFEVSGPDMNWGKGNIALEFSATTCKAIR